jgi:GH25 family lysozyme M1 (1,4-beta-N-acetylmuramidase)
MRYPIWIADYSTRGRGQENPKVPNGNAWTVWQFSDKGKLGRGDIAAASIDVKIFKGTPQQFRRLLNIPAN